MLVGNGDIASVLPKDDKRLTFFASGVSNSQETSERKYNREIDLLLEQRRDAHIVYFGSLAVFYSDTRYAQHKRYMEALVKENFPTYTIVRIGNITWGDNPNTLINYLKANPDAEIRDEYRYVVDQEEFLHWIGKIPDWSCEMNIPGKMMKVEEIKREYC